MTKQRQQSQARIGRAQHFLLMLLLFFAFSNLVRAQTPTTNIDLGRQADHYLDRNGSETITSLTSAEGRNRFQRSAQSVANYGVRPTRNAVMWLRVEVPDLSRFGAIDWVLSHNEPRTRRFTLYLPDGSAFRERVWTAGVYDHDPVSVSRYPVVHIPAGEISGKVIHVRIETASSMRGFLWLSTERSFDWSYSRSGYLLGAMSGALLALSIFLLANGLFARDKAALALAGGLISYLLYFIAHHAVLDTYLAPGAIEVSRPMSIGATFGIFSFLALFSYFALEIRKNFPRLHWVFVVIIIALFIASLVVIADVLLGWFWVRAYSAQIGVMSRAITLIAALLTLTKDWRRALLFLMCWLPSIIGSNLRMLHDVWPALGTSEVGLNSAYLLSMISMVLFAMLTSLDIHAREKRLSAALAAQTERVRAMAEHQKLAAVGQMAGRIAHEVNNLLHPIINLARRTKDKATPEPERIEALGIITEAAERASEVVTALLGSVKPDQDAARLMPLSQAVKQASAVISAMIPSAIRMEAAIGEAGGPVVAYGDAFRLLVNLVANAVQAMDGSGTIRITFDQTDRGSALSVLDTGRGMDEATRQHALEPFFTTRTGNGGTGLGLAVVGDIVTSWRGTIALESALGRGTTITIAVPDAPADTQANLSKESGW